MIKPNTSFFGKIMGGGFSNDSKSRSKSPNQTYSPVGYEDALEEIEAEELTSDDQGDEVFYNHVEIQDNNIGAEIPIQFVRTTEPESISEQLKMQAMEAEAALNPGYIDEEEFYSDTEDTEVPVQAPRYTETYNPETSIEEDEEFIDEPVYVGSKVQTLSPSIQTEQAPRTGIALKDQEPRVPGGPSSGEEWLSDYDGLLNIDMYQTRDNIVLVSTIAGVRPEDIDVTVANDMVSIKGERKPREPIEQSDYFYQECYWGNFSRSIIVPVDIDPENIEADLKDGILTITIPKAAKAKTKKIRVKG